MARSRPTPRPSPSWRSSSPESPPSPAISRRGGPPRSTLGSPSARSDQPLTPSAAFSMTAAVMTAAAPHRTAGRARTRAASVPLHLPRALEPLLRVALRRASDFVARGRALARPHMLAPDLTVLGGALHRPSPLLVGARRSHLPHLVTRPRPCRDPVPLRPLRRPLMHHSLLPDAPVFHAPAVLRDRSARHHVATLRLFILSAELCRPHERRIVAQGESVAPDLGGLDVRRGPGSQQRPARHRTAGRRRHVDLRHPRPEEGDPVPRDPRAAVPEVRAQVDHLIHRH